MKHGHALVIGGTRGIGLALAELWLRQGLTVSVVGRREPARRLRGAKLQFVDLRNPIATTRAVDALLKKEGALSRAAFCQRARSGNDDWSEELETNLSATRRLLEQLSGSFVPGGAVTLIGSLAGRFVADEQGPGYHATKGALGALTRYYAVKLAPKVRVNMVVPGLALKLEARDFYQKNRKLRNLYARIIPLGRMPSAQEVAQAAAWLCSPEASAITGQELVVDGGMSLAYQPSLARRLTDAR